MMPPHVRSRCCALLTAVIALATPTFSQCQRAKLLDPHGAAGDLFGYSAGALNQSAVAVGAVLDDEAEENSGSVSVFGTETGTGPVFDA